MGLKYYSPPPLPRVLFSIREEIQDIMALNIKHPPIEHSHWRGDSKYFGHEILRPSTSFDRHHGLQIL